MSVRPVKCINMYVYNNHVCQGQAQWSEKGREEKREEE